MTSSTRAFYSRENIRWWCHTSNAWTVPGCEFDRVICEERNCELPNAWRVHTYAQLFWAIRLFIAEFQYCRALLSIHGTHLYENYKCCVFIPMGVDADGRLYPLAVTVVAWGIEASWYLFTSSTYNLIPSVHQQHRITFISDWMKVTPNALRDCWPSLYAIITVWSTLEIVLGRIYRQNLAYFTMGSQLCSGSRSVQGQKSRIKSCMWRFRPLDIH